MERFNKLNNIDKRKLEPDDLRLHMEDVKHIESSP